MTQFGKIVYNHNNSPYVKVEVDQEDAVPLSLKAMPGQYRKCNLTVGRYVLVERTTGGYKGWRIKHLFKRDFEPSSLNTGDSEMGICKKRHHVRFQLPPRYFQSRSHNQNTMDRDTCVAILVKSFGESSCYWYAQMDEHPEGLTIICRKSQFADFIVNRHDKGDCTNGVRDLAPEFVDQKVDQYTEIANSTGVCRNAVKKVLLALAYSGDEDREINVTHN